MPPTAPRVGDTQNQAWKNDKSKFGLKMMQKMGWTEGKGLGKNEDGVSEHVKVSKKSNNLGLGATHDSSGAAGWASAADVKGFSAAELRAILGQAATTADPSLPSYPVVRGGYGAEAAAAAATDPKISKKKSSNKKSKGSKSTTLDAPPRRPRTRSMDETAPLAEPAAIVGGKRPRDQPVDHAGEGEEAEGEAAASSTTASAPRKSKKKKGGASEGEGEGCETAPVAGSSKDKKRAKKSKKHKGR
ncbi:conserved unknown protein [Ectocarpus siliculosus]|uniref:PinX1-related protein 1 n=1 Tax=Ectocarpus siliculosus TaxID=2880 RepID=D7FQC4_ECTSI|nr:conserved unknown protein [Ectocarpus siliculosus]|eukprot:CBJ48456.1 conserved unknown protein [Ectocarpus siliculosus]